MTDLLKTRLKAKIAYTEVFKEEAIKDSSGSPHYYYNQEKQELRAMYLFYAFKRGIPYSKVEQRARTCPPWIYFRRIAFKNGIMKPYLRGIKLNDTMLITYGLDEDLLGQIGDPERYPSNRVPFRNQEFLDMEKWIAEAKEHYESNPLYVDPEKQSERDTKKYLKEKEEFERSRTLKKSS